MRVRAWLSQQGCRDICRNPNDPPDFVLHGGCAVEVTRLNERILVENEEQSKGEEEARTPLTETIESVVREIELSEVDSYSWDVTCEYSFRKALPKEKVVELEVGEALALLSIPFSKSIYQRHIDSMKHGIGSFCTVDGSHVHIRFVLNCGIRLHILGFPYEPPRINLVQVSDGEGSFVEGEMLESVKHAVCEKSRKISQKCSRGECRLDEYDCWWLILVDYFCLPELTRYAQKKMEEQEFYFWNRVTVVNPGLWSINGGPWTWAYDLKEDGVCQSSTKICSNRFFRQQCP